MECDIRIHIYIKVNYEKSGKLQGSHLLVESFRTTVSEI